MKAKRRFTADVLASIRSSKILGIRAGARPHRFIGLWVVVVEGRVFVRSWGVKPGGWYRTLVEEPRGAIDVAGREIPVRAVRTRSERLKDAVDRAYRAKYNTPGSLKYVRDLQRAKSRDTTTELVPVQRKPRDISKELIMAELKTKPTERNVERFLNSIKDNQKRQDCFTILELMQQVTGAEARMWGSSIVGFGSYHYRYASGREGDWFLAGFSPRKQNLTLYIMAGFEQYDELLKSLGQYTTGKACLYIKRLDDIHLPTLRKLVRQSVKHMLKASA
jgi:hypothetical protein